MFPELKGKVLFVFSDPGGAKPIMTLADKRKNALVVSDRQYAFSKDFDLVLKADVQEPEIIIQEFKPDTIVTGTSYRSDLEKQFHLLAFKHKIPCYAFVDHWTSINIRFEQKDGTFLYPDKICVIDQRAKQICLEAGIPESKLVITGNPYHEWLSKWKPAQSKEQIMKAAGISLHHKQLLLFAPDPLSNVNGKEMFGFDELEVVKQLSDLFENNTQLNNWILAVKPHPNQQLNKLTQAVTNSNVCIVPLQIDTNTLMFYANAVMGFFSSILIEADIIGKPVLRYLPNQLNNDPLEGLNIGQTTDYLRLPDQLQHLFVNL